MFPPKVMYIIYIYLYIRIDPTWFFSKKSQFGADKADRIYDDMPDMEKIANVLQDYLDDYNLINPKEVKLVFFQDAIEHVSRYSAVKCLIIH